MNSKCPIFNVLVTGAAGAIGRPLVKRLCDLGYSVRVLVRNPATWQDRESVEFVQGDLFDSQTLRRATSGIDFVLHLAAKLHVNNPSRALRAEYQRVNVEGTRRLADEAYASDVRSVIFFSTINVYGISSGGQIFDEKSPLRPESYYAETKMQAEEVLLTMSRCTILRLAAVYGATMKGNYVRLLDAIRRGRFVMLGDGQNRRTLVHVEDVCTAALKAMQNANALGEIFNVTDGNIHTLQDIVANMSMALGRTPPSLQLPVGPVRIIASIFDGAIRPFYSRYAVMRPTVEKLVEDVAVSGVKIQRELDFTPMFDLHSGWKSVVQGK